MRAEDQSEIYRRAQRSLLPEFQKPEFVAGGMDSEVAQAQWKFLKADVLEAVGLTADRLEALPDVPRLVDEDTRDMFDLVPLWFWPEQPSARMTSLSIGGRVVAAMVEFRARGVVRTGYTLVSDAELTQSVRPEVDAWFSRVFPEGVPGDRKNY